MEGIGVLLILAALAGVVVSFVALFRPVEALKLDTRKRAGVGLLGSLVVLLMAPALIPEPTPEELEARRQRAEQRELEREREERERKASAKAREEKRQAEEKVREQKRKFEAAVAEKKKEQEERQKRIERGFSAWDGSHRQLTRAIKAQMNDPDSYQHDTTRYGDRGDHLVVETTFRGRNAFGGMIRHTVRAKVDLDGNILEFLDFR